MEKEENFETVETLIKEYKKESLAIKEAQERQGAILDKIISAKDKAWDLISIQKAAFKSGLSVPTIYRFINMGKLHTVHKGGRALISESELLAMDDKAVNK